MTADSKINDYLEAVRAYLGQATASEEEAIIRAVAARIRSSAEEPGETVESVLERLGHPKKLAVQYRDARLVAKAIQGYSPTLLLHAALRTGIPGLSAFLFGLAGYWFGGGLLVFGTLMILWSAIHYTLHTPGAIGPGMLEIIALIGGGILILVFTTLVLRVLLGAFQRMRSPLSPE